MLKIRSLGPPELEQVLNLLSRYGSQAYDTLQRYRALTLPFLQLSRCMVARFQFLPAIYVACQDHHVLGVIVLSPDGSQNRRWRVEELIVDPDVSTLDVGSQLLGYVMNRYGAEGVQTFVAHVGQTDVDALTLLKINGYRFCTRLTWFTCSVDQWSPSSQADELSWGNVQLKEACPADAPRICQVYNDGLPPEIRVSLEKCPPDFLPELTVRYWLQRVRGKFFRRWVLEETNRKVIIAAVELTSTNLTDYHLTVMVSPVWSNYTDKLYQFGIDRVQRMSRHNSVTTAVFEHDKHGLQQAENSGFIPQSVVDVLVKDFWVPLKPERPKLTSPVLLRHIAPA